MPVYWISHICSPFSLIPCFNTPHGITPIFPNEGSSVIDLLRLTEKIYVSKRSPWQHPKHKGYLIFISKQEIDCNAGKGPDEHRLTCLSHGFSQLRSNWAAFYSVGVEILDCGLRILDFPGVKAFSKNRNSALLSIVNSQYSIQIKPSSLNALPTLQWTHDNIMKILTFMPNV